MAYEWVDCERVFVARRYDRIAGLITFFEWLFFLPAGLRRQAVEHIGLAPGSRVLELGCGTGRNLPFLRNAVGPAGHVYGVDLSARMLERARGIRQRAQWGNVTLVQGDAAEYRAPEMLDGVLFSLSYNTMPHHLEVLRHALSQLRPGGRVVIMDAKLPPGWAGKLLLPFAVWLNRRTVLGNPTLRPWEDLARLTDRFEMRERLFASYYICRGIKREERAGV